MTKKREEFYSFFCSVFFLPPKNGRKKFVMFFDFKAVLSEIYFTITMESLLKQSGKFFNGLGAQIGCLLLASTLLYINVAVIFELARYDPIVKDDFDLLFESGGTKEEFKVFQQKLELLYEHPILSLNSQFLALCIIEAAIFGGIIIGLCFSWFIFSSLRPKIILLAALSINAILVFLNAFIPYYWLFVGFRIGIGIVLSIGHTSIALLLLDWSHASNQPLSIHFMFSTRSIAVLVISFILFCKISWRSFFFVYPFLFIIAIVLNLIFVKESPRWLRKHGKLSEYSNLVINFGKKLGRTISGENAFADDLESRDPEKRSPLPTPAELTALTGFYIVNAVASIILQGSASSTIPWDIEIIILACIYLFAAIITTPLYSYGKIPVIVFTLTAIMITVMLLFFPQGIFYGTFLQAAKFNSAINDHFALFLLFTVITPRVGERWPAMTQREWRAKVILGIETLAVAARIFGIFFVLRTNDAKHQTDRRPKLAIVLACYGFGLVMVILGRYVFKRGVTKPTTRKPENDKDDREIDEPFIPPKPEGDDDDKPKPKPRPPPPKEPESPPVEDDESPSSPSSEPSDIIVVGGDTDDVDIDI